MTLQRTALPDKPWFSAKEVAAYYGTTVQTIHNKRKRGQLVARLKGTRTYQFSRESLLELDRRATAVPSDTAPAPLDVRAFAALLRKAAEILEREVA